MASSKDDYAYYTLQEAEMEIVETICSNDLTNSQLSYNLT